MNRCLNLISPTRRYYFPFHISGVFAAILLIYYVTNDGGRTSLSLRMPPTAQDTLWWQFMSAALVHMDSYHMYNNLVLLLFAGGIFEVIHGPIPSVAVFWIGGSTGALFQSAWWGGPDGVHLMGASAGAYALVAAHIAHLCLNWKETPFRVPFFATIVCYLTLTITFVIISPGYNIAHIAHWVGFIQGLLVGLITVQNIRVLRWENAVSGIAFLLAAGVLVSGCIKCGLRSTIVV